MNGRLSQQQIRDAENDLVTIPQKINEYQTSNADLQKQMAPALALLREKREGLQDVDHRLFQLNARIAMIDAERRLPMLEKSLAEANKEFAEAKNHLQAITQQIKPLAADIERAKIYLQVHDVRNSLAGKKSQRSALNSQLHLANDNYTYAQGEIAIVESELQSAQGRLSHLSANRELDQMRDNIHHSSHHHHHHHHRHHIIRPSVAHVIGDVLHSVGDMVADAEISRLQSEVARLQASVRKKKDNASHLSSTASHYRADLEIISEEVDDDERFLGRYESNVVSDIYELRAQLAKLLRTQAALASSERIAIDRMNRATHNQSTLDYKVLSTRQDIVIKSSVAKELVNNHDVADLNLQVSGRQERRLPLLAAVDDCNRQAQHLQASIDFSQNLIQQGQQKLNQINADDQLMRLFRDADGLTAELKNNLQTQIQSYEVNDPVGQSPIARVLLINVSARIRCIEDAAEGSTSQLKFYRLIGLLKSMLDEARQQQGDRLFVQLLETVLMQHAFVNWDECELMYRNFATLHYAPMNQVNVHTLLPFEQALFDQEKEQFVSELRLLPIHQSKKVENLQTKGHQLVASLEKNPENRNDKFSTTILRNAKGLLANSLDVRSQSRHHLIHLATQDHRGQPNVCKIVLGAIMSFIGAALVAVSVAAKALTLGLSTPVTAVLAVGGIGLFAGGVAMVKANMKRGVPKGISDFNNAAIAVDRFRLMAAPRTMAIELNQSNPAFELTERLMVAP